MGLYEWESCPHCGKRVSEFRRGVASDTTIGGPKSECPHCGGLFLTEKSEWNEKSSLGRFGYYVRVGWWCLGVSIIGFWGGFLASVIIFGMILKFPDDQWSSIGVVLGIFAVFVGNILVIKNSREEIKESIARR